MKKQNGIALVIGLLLVVLCSGISWAADYPSKPIKIIVPFNAGDAVDATARVIAERMKKDLRTPVVVQNIAGGGGAIGIAEAAKAPADGYHLVMASTGALTARPLISNPGYRTDDFIPLAQLVEVPLGLAVRTQSPFNSVNDVIIASKGNRVTYATPAPGTTQHIKMSELAIDQGLQLTHIGGKGGKGAVTKALTGEVDFVFVGASNYVALAKSGKLKVLAVAADERVPYLPDVKTFSEQGMPMNAAVWFGLLVRKGTPPDIVEKLKKSIYDVAQDEKTRKLYKKLHLNEAFLDADAFQDRITRTVQNHRKILEEIGLAK